MIKVQDLQFSYQKETSFIKNMSFAVTPAEIFGFLGPSGAGKSTLQKILCGILRNYEGSVCVLGNEVKLRKANFYNQIGVDFEFPNFYCKFSALENLRYFSSLYGETVRECDIMSYLKRVELADQANKKVAQFSKGMKMRLAFVRAILHRPKLLFLDEPTSGLDPAYARLIKEMIVEQKQLGTTVILTTHNMYDADDLCDRVAFISDGSIKAIDTPLRLKRQQQAVMVNYTHTLNGQTQTGRTPIAKLASDNAFLQAMRLGTLTSIHSNEYTLEDVFINITGRQLQ